MIKLIKSSFYEEEKTKVELVRFIKDAEVLSFNAQCELFEKKFASYQKRENCIFLNSGSSANLAVIQSLLNLGKLKVGDNVAFSAVTWSTNVMPLMQLGLNPVPIDVEMDTLNVSYKGFKEAMERFNIKAFIITNLLGFCDSIDKISDECKENNIILIEDNCESLGTQYRGKLLGNYGYASTFSFYVGHHMSTIEGGAVCTDDEDLATMVRLVRAHGWDRNLTLNQQENMRKKFKVNSTFYSRYTFYDLGFNLRPTEINGFLGNVQLNYLDEILHKRNANFIKIANSIYNNSNYFPIRYDHIDFVSNFAIPIICKNQKIRDELVERCDGKVEIRPIVGGDMTKQPFYSKYVSSKLPTNSNAELIHNQGLYFGNNPDLTDDEINMLIDIFS